MGTPEDVAAEKHFTPPDEDLLLPYQQFVELYGKRPPDIAYNMAIILARPVIERLERERIAKIAHEYLNAGICDICYEDNCGDEFSCTKGEDGEPCECHSRINDARAKLEQALKGEG